MAGTVKAMLGSALSIITLLAVTVDSKVETPLDDRIDWQVVSDGGGWSSTSALKLFSVLSQTATGESSNSGFHLQHGFVQRFGSQSCCIGVSGNVDCDPNSVVDIADLTVLIDHLFISLTPLCCREEGNVDGDPNSVVDIADLTFLIDHLFISLIPTTVCQ